MPIIKPRIGYRSSASLSGPKPKEEDGLSLVNFLATLQKNSVSLLPISPHKGLRIIGRGLSGLIEQSSADILTDFAFKHGIPSGRARDSKKSQEWQSLLTEVEILQHPPIKKNPHVIDLLGVSFSVDSSMAQPVMVTLKANRGVAHGDIKPENILVKQSQEGAINCMFTDFGSSVIEGQNRLPTSSEPWNAPELQASLEPVHFEFLRQADIYAFGLMCVHILVPLRDLEKAGLSFIRRPDDSDDQWSQMLDNLKAIKLSKAGKETLQDILLSLFDSVDISAKRKELLECLIKATLQPLPEDRQIPWGDIYNHIRDYLSDDDDSTFIPLRPLDVGTSAHSEHFEFNLSTILGELDDTDYILRRSFAQDLLHKANHIGCIECIHRYAFQVAIVHALGLFEPQDSVAIQRLGKSQRDQEDLLTAIGSIGNKYQVPGRVAKDILDHLGVHVLVSANRIQGYELSGRIREAESFLRQEINARIEALGGNHRALAKPSSELARVLASQCRFSEAVQLQEEVVDILEAYFNDHHPAPLLAKCDLAQLKFNQSILKNAEALYETVIPQLQAATHPQHADVIAALQNFANVRISLGKLKQAATTMKDVVAMRGTQFSLTHPATITAKINLIRVTYLQRNTNRAAQMIEELEESIRGSLSSDDILNAWIGLTKAAINSDPNNAEAAEADVTRVLELLDRLELPQGDPLRVHALLTLALVYKESRKFREQEGVLRGIVQHSDAHGPGDVMTRIDLAGCLLAQGRYPEACEIATEVISSEAGRKMAVPGEAFAGYQILSQAASRQGDKRGAMEIQQRCLESCEDNLGPENDATLEARFMLASSFEDLGDYQEAQRQMEELLQYLRDTDSLASWGKLCDAARLLGRVCLAQTKFSEAESYCRQGLEWALQMLGDDHSKTIELRCLLARTYLSRGKDADAEAILSHEFLSQARGSETESYVLQILATLKEHQGCRVEAIQLKAKALQLNNEILGENHPETVGLRGDLLQVALDMEPLSPDLESLILQNIEAKKIALGSNHRLTIKGMMGLASAYGKARRFDEAESLITEINGIPLPDPALHANNLARTAAMYEDMGRWNEAQELRAQIIEIRKSIFGENHEYVLTSMSNLASTLYRSGELEHAEKLLQQVMAIREPHMLASEKSTSMYLQTKASLAATMFDRVNGRGIRDMYDRARVQESRDMYVQILEVGEREGMPSNDVAAWRAQLEAVERVLRNTQS
ncbi:hypothetical protein BCR34DRAFT_614986 [Clohesyomyces aquaticus]|uniref:Protein kinase domain-containing protein n=1 Tax=Clohesyomyces aquaticus TaxID=1231657 RepID=A0A1Y1ZKM6_9PLEO|nr:hypothetical protein BCR34DRAFT_614986 [Clohesyomyces aquaticus]